MGVAGVDREYFVLLPKTYDPMRAYRTVFLFHGCGGKDNNVPIQNVSREDAIVIHGSSVGDCPGCPPAWDRSLPSLSTIKTTPPMSLPAVWRRVIAS
jgi:hypothetical protein